jgi:hypothetical protein
MERCPACEWQGDPGHEDCPNCGWPIDVAFTEERHLLFRPDATTEPGE